MLFWAFLVSTLVYLVFGIACALSMRLLKKGVSVFIAFLFLGFGELKVVSVDAVVCKCSFILYTPPPVLILFYDNVFDMIIPDTDFVTFK